jgi:hypothetical protein
MEAHETDEKPKQVTHEQRFTASAMPDRILLSWQSDPATTFSVTWRTDTTVDVGIGEIAVATDGPKFVDKKTRVLRFVHTFLIFFGRDLLRLPL